MTDECWTALAQRIDVHRRVRPHWLWPCFVLSVFALDAAPKGTGWIGAEND